MSRAELVPCRARAVAAAAAPTSLQCLCGLNYTGFHELVYWALVSESDNRAPDCPIVRFAGVCTKSDVVNLVFEPDAR